MARLRPARQRPPAMRTRLPRAAQITWDELTGGQGRPTDDHTRPDSTSRPEPVVGQYLTRLTCANGDFSFAPGRCGTGCDCYSMIHARAIEPGRIRRAAPAPASPQRHGQGSLSAAVTPTSSSSRCLRPMHVTRAMAVDGLDFDRGWDSSRAMRSTVQTAAGGWGGTSASGANLILSSSYLLLRGACHRATTIGGRAETSTWSWASEPLRRVLELTYAGRNLAQEGGAAIFPANERGQPFLRSAGQHRSRSMRTNPGTRGGAGNNCGASRSRSGSEAATSSSGKTDSAVVLHARATGRARERGRGRPRRPSYRNHPARC